ncbi:MAG: hypothetical protein AB7W47_15755 [Calditrichaceae bacterium]
MLNLRSQLRLLSEKITGKERIVIGIHGLNNKPPRELLHLWWKQAIQEGLARIGHHEELFTLEIAYWANLLHPEPLNPNIKDAKNLLYIEAPYVRGNPDSVKVKPNLKKKRMLDKIERRLDEMFFDEDSFLNYDFISDLIIRNMFKDLDIYYNRDCPVKTNFGLCAREAIRIELADLLIRHRNKKILLIAHSMGSIIAYDVLTQVVPDIQIDTMITIGSPLGLPSIQKKIFEEQGKEYRVEKQVSTPENIQKNWYNFSDLDDKVAINYNLADDFKKNSRDVGPQDFIVVNDYIYNDEKNNHKSYGYLRTPEVANEIYRFLRPEKTTFAETVRTNFKEILKTFSETKK